jgi:hypothetical protein
VSIDRRELLKMSLALAGGSLAAGVAHAAGDELAPVPRPVDEALPGVFEQEAAVLAAPTFQIEPPKTVSGWSQEKLLTQSIATTLWTGRIYALTPEERAAPMYRAIVASRVEAMAETLYATAAHLEAADEASMAAFAQHLRDEPELITEVHDRMIAEGRAQGVPEEALDRFRRAHAHAAWRLQHQDVTALRDELVGKLDRSAARKGVDWRAQARRGAELPFVRPVQGAVDADGKGGAASKRDGMTQSEHEAMGKKHHTAGAVMLGIGVPLLIGGGAAGFAAPPLFALATAGIILLVIGAIYLASGARHRRKARDMAAASAATPETQAVPVAE